MTTLAPLCKNVNDNYVPFKKMLCYYPYYYKNWLTSSTLFPQNLFFLSFCFFFKRLFYSSNHYCFSLVLLRFFLFIFVMLSLWMLVIVYQVVLGNLIAQLFMMVMLTLTRSCFMENKLCYYLITFQLLGTISLNYLASLNIL